MSVLEAFLLGILQGLTEFLPVSSSGHLELGKVWLDVSNANDTTFTVVAHAGTALSTIIVFWDRVKQLLLAPFHSRKSESFQYLLFVLIAAVPVVVLGLLARDAVDALFNGNLLLVGSCLLVTSGLLFFASRARDRGGEVTGRSAWIIGLAQAVAVLPGISRSGATISTALMLGIRRDRAARFSFLIVLIPIFGVMGLDGLKLATGAETLKLGWAPLLTGFITSFFVGLLACRWMVRIVQRGGLVPFSLYCLLVGLVTLYFGFAG
ncbi:MAG: undecaprenyl-diphosphate phosphatase [Bacteroidetes bacterium]|jgi:undecaprenyl-diphosphatase|nr:undecaprenyl-diphosphate phosphatase [Bacteroidota bacterium]